MLTVSHIDLGDKDGCADSLISHTGSMLVMLSGCRRSAPMLR